MKKILLLSRITTIILLTLFSAGCSQNLSTSSDFGKFKPVNPYTEEETQLVQKMWYPPKNDDCESILYSLMSVSLSLNIGLEKFTLDETDTFLSQEMLIYIDVFEDIASKSNSIAVQDWASNASVVFKDMYDSTYIKTDLDGFKKIGYEFKQLLMNPPDECVN